MATARSIDQYPRQLRRKQMKESKHQAAAIKQSASQDNHHPARRAIMDMTKICR
jgi:hypothetical protein